MADSPTEKARVLTLDIKPHLREAIKPAELIQVTGHHELTLNARRAVTILWHHAHSQGSRDRTESGFTLKGDGRRTRPPFGCPN